MKITEFLRSSSKTIWDAILNNIVVLVLAFIFSGGYLIAINKVLEFQDWIREIPTDYVLTPFVLTLVLLAVLVKINRRQKSELSKFREEPIIDKQNGRFVTHVGVWWKVYPESEYIEDFPYCSCCDNKLKLVQTEWYPDEVYVCPKTKTEYKLFDEIPWKKEKILESLYSAYFEGFGSQFERMYFGEFQRLRELNPDWENIDYCRKLFELEPLSMIPEEEKSEIFKKKQDAAVAFRFIQRHYRYYKQYFDRWGRDDESSSP